jgi:hypothetical protein
MRDFLQAIPEGIFEADAGAVSINKRWSIRVERARLSSGEEV